MDYTSNADISALESLSPETIFNILLRLPAEDILKFCRVSRSLRPFCNDWTFWAIKAERDFKFPFPLFKETSIEDPRQRYLQILEYYRNVNVFNAAENGLSDIVQYLLSRSSPDYYDINVTLALEGAAEGGHLDLVGYLIDIIRNKMPNMKVYYLNLALQRAGIGGHIDVADYLISQGATDLNKALAAAGQFGHLEMVRHLISRGAKSLFAAYTLALQNGYTNVSNYLLPFILPYLNEEEPEEEVEEEEPEYFD